MILDRKGSIKKKVAVVLTTLTLANALNPAIVKANTEKSNINIDYVYDDDHVGRYGSRDEGNYKLVIISDLENGRQVVITVEKLDEILKTSKGEIIEINGETFPREEIINYKKRIYDETKRKKQEKERQMIQTLVVFAVLGSIGFGSGFIIKKGYVVYNPITKSYHDYKNNNIYSKEFYESKFRKH